VAIGALAGQLVAIALRAVIRAPMSLHPDQLGLHVFLARVQEKQARIDAAEETLFAARQQQPASEEPFRLLAAFYARRVPRLEWPRRGSPTISTAPFGAGVLRVGGNVHRLRRGRHVDASIR
jgi:hypothetical protein